jgi:hypothetical protein
MGQEGEDRRDVIAEKVENEVPAGEEENCRKQKYGRKVGEN